MISYSDFEKVDIRVGTVVEAKINEKSNKPSIYLVIDFGNDIVLFQCSNYEIIVNFVHTISKKAILIIVNTE